MKALRAILPFLAGLLQFSCTERVPVASDAEHVWVTVEALTASAAATRTSYAGDPESVEDLWVGAFRTTDGAFVSSAYCDAFPADGKIQLSLLSNYDYHIYTLCNVRGLSVEGRTMDSLGELDNLVRRNCSCEDSFRESPLSIALPELGGFRGGLPMAGYSAFSWSEIAAGVTLSPERLYARYEISFTNRDAGLVSYSMTYLALRQAAADVRPFAATQVDGYAAGDFRFASTGSSFVDGDFTAEASGILDGTSSGGVVLYVPENMQGRLLKGNASAEGKIPSALESPSVPSLTYLEMGFKLNGNAPYISNSRTVAVNGVSYPADIIYRIYLGRVPLGNESLYYQDFCIERNVSARISVEGTDEGLRSHIADAGDATWREDADITIGPTAVDLGLPSGTLWADRNIGAERDIRLAGDLFAWGETATKDTFSEYDYSDPANLPDIMGTIYDAATVNWGVYAPLSRNWTMPMDTNVEELVDNCTFTDVREGDLVEVTSGSFTAVYAGLKLTGPNGNSIFLPGRYEKVIESKISNYWTSTRYRLYTDCAHIMLISFNNPPRGVANHALMTHKINYAGCLVRPVITE